MPTIHSDTEISRLLEKGVLGFYTHFEITEIFLVSDNDKKVRNFFSIVVAEELTSQPDQTPRYMGKPIRLQSTKGASFGIKRSYLSTECLLQRLQTYRSSGEWQLSDQPLCVGPLSPIARQFVPADATENAPLNKILKNNFWSGSHVLELMDTDKTPFYPFFEEPNRLQQISAEVQERVPLNLASLSDRIGNIIMQFPVTILVALFGENFEDSQATVAVHWQQKATPRPLTLFIEKEHDQILTGCVFAPFQGPVHSVNIADGFGMQRGILWDVERRLILAATAPSAFVRFVNIDTRIQDPEPRIFDVKGADELSCTIRVGLVDTMKSHVDLTTIDRRGDWTRKRIYREQANRLAAQRRFVQYKPLAGQVKSVHERALSDLRHLLSQYGKQSAWLWDPFLSAVDIINTLFYCPFKGADLRALTAAYERPVAPRPKPTFSSIRIQCRELIRNKLFGTPKRETFAERQRLEFSSCKSNYRGLRLEYRMRSGQAGWNFHDRFLIFPLTDDGPLAWSLGSSVNSVGRQHHILQQVDDARLIADAFDELWKQLDGPEHLIWKEP